MGVMQQAVGNTRYRPIPQSIQLEHTWFSFTVKYGPSSYSLRATCIKNPHTSAFRRFLCSFFSSEYDMSLTLNCSIRRCKWLRMFSASTRDLWEMKLSDAHFLSSKSGERSIGHSGANERTNFAGTDYKR